MKIDTSMMHDTSELIRDLAQMTTNAKMYFPPGSPVYLDACALEAFCIQQLQLFFQQGLISSFQWPNLMPSISGDPIHLLQQQQQHVTPQMLNERAPYNAHPFGHESPVNPFGMHDHVKYEDDGSDDLFIDESEDSSEAAKRKRSFTSKRQPLRPADTKRQKSRPAKVNSPLEARAKVIMRQVRRYRDATGRQLFAPFERLPDTRLFPEYYQAIQHPMALEVIQKKLNKHQYQSIDEFVKDFYLMFDNAKVFNDPSSQVYRDADFLERYLTDVMKVESQKEDHEEMFVEPEVHVSPNRSFAKADKIQLPHVPFDDGLLSVGDWVHIYNQNDPNKPIIAQIFKIWKGVEGVPYVTACWYYRPEQTVHRADRVFYENEVFKTSQYRDHPVSEIVGRCFVMYITRFVRGRPKGLNAITPIYVCESRYNEDTKQFSKIKSWKNCLPEEVRNKDYEMDMYERTIVPFKVASPLLHLLAEKTQMTMSGERIVSNEANAPPLQGAILPPKDTTPGAMSGTMSEYYASPDRVVGASASMMPTSTVNTPNSRKSTPTLQKPATSNMSQASPNMGFLSMQELSSAAVARGMPNMGLTSVQPPMSIPDANAVVAAAAAAAANPPIPKQISPRPSRPVYQQQPSQSTAPDPALVYQMNQQQAHPAPPPQSVTPQTRVQLPHYVRTNSATSNASLMPSVPPEPTNLLGSGSTGSAFLNTSSAPFPLFPVAFVIPGTQEEAVEAGTGFLIGEKTARTLQQTEDGQIVWYSVPPMEPAKPSHPNYNLQHSLKWKEHKLSQAASSKDHADDKIDNSRAQGEPNSSEVEELASTALELLSESHQAFVNETSTSGTAVSV
ncbi:RSC complex subunit Rsc1 [Schizosaccharomyces japonicus yFS275]|uniref:RSC complex subunit Rsc1 n=1 Tax=Schizosaccharomyces japonicus (strain yFS275 / FY16936) TaxID=402676 RepID=B6K521_SCHJY|nr:RSC complex subunit Rsc1 [Schizosaccharomyces japonicus yFS275]EEB08625.2 RSC complex subunit Rsc1 [Schizosaccharomyces japonicus yFS275]